MAKKQKHASLDPVALGLSLGIIWSVGVLFIGLVAWSGGFGTGFVDVVGSLYAGYTPTLIGSIIGAVLAFIDAFVGGWVVAWLYNKLRK